MLALAYFDGFPDSTDACRLKSDDFGVIQFMRLISTTKTKKNDDGWIKFYSVLLLVMVLDSMLLLANEVPKTRNGYFSFEGKQPLDVILLSHYTLI